MSRQPRTSAGRPQLVGDLVSGFLSRKGLDARVEAASVVADWQELVGPQISGVTEPLRVSDGVLFVAVSSSSWMMELDLMKSALMRRLNAGKRAGRIEKIVFVMN
ncbi:MAG TPA: DUF721 domain-containing protein [Longimicrobiaceae bacterium]|nr:DUF721 domain-containing protein [Longimicrobiaceae bacterium]